MIRGRKRKPGIMQTAIDARRRHFGVTARQARDARLGTSLGRLAYQELISSAQYEAGRRFAELYQRRLLLRTERLRDNFLYWLPLLSVILMDDLELCPKHQDALLGRIG